MSEYPKGPVPYLITPGECAKHVEWLKSVFDAEVKAIHHTEDSKQIMHCWLQVNGGPLYLADQCCIISEKLGEGQLPETGAEDVKVAIGTTKSLFTHLQYPTEAAVDAVWKKALDNGATVCSELQEQLWGDKYGTFLDPMGFQWAVAATVREYHGPPGKQTTEEATKTKE